MSVQVREPSFSGQRRVDDLTIRAVVFEPAGVLYDVTPRRRWLWQLVTRLGLQMSYDEFIRPWETVFLPAVHRGERNYRDAMHEFLRSLSLSTANVNEVEAAVPLRGHPLEQGIRALPGVARALGQLSAAGISLTTLCDCCWSESEFREHLDGMGLGYFATVITSADLGSVKPSKKNYEAVTSALGVPPVQCVMVSNRPVDLTGASSLGWRTVGFATPADSELDAQVISAAEMTKTILQWPAAKLKAVG
jgi:FMN phosphatase YigB (HAD superfamily)